MRFGPEGGGGGEAGREEREYVVCLHRRDGEEGLSMMCIVLSRTQLRFFIISFHALKTLLAGKPAVCAPLRSRS